MKVEALETILQHPYVATFLPQTFFFWSTLNIFQRIFGLMGFYAGRNGTLLIGGGIVVSSTILSEEVRDLAIKQIKKTPYWKYFSNQINPDMGMKNQIRLSVLTLMIYSLLSLNFWKTTLPSSVITLGAYTPFSIAQSTSVESDSPIASSSQRRQIQRLGKVYGCHHCGNRQLFGNTFIADHMPPTAIARQMNQVWWRRWFKIHVKQRLWPQCQSCFKQQGMAVLQRSHKLIYHHNIRPHHFSLFIATYLNSQLIIKQALDPIMDHVEKWLSKGLAAVTAVMNDKRR